MAVATAMPPEIGSKVHPFFLQKTSTPDIEIDPNSARRKRQKSASPTCESEKANGEGPHSTTWIEQLNAAAVEASTGSQTITEVPQTPPKQSLNGIAKPQKISANPSTNNGNSQPSSKSSALVLPSTTPATPSPQSKSSLKISPAKRLLRVRSDGKLGSPRKETQAQETKIRRPRRSKEQIELQKAGVVVIKYGKRKKARILLGQKIDTILSSLPSLQAGGVPVKEKALTKQPPKPTHPFFSSGMVRGQGVNNDSGKAPTNDDTLAQSASPKKASSPKTQRVNSRPPGLPAEKESSSFRGFPTFGSDHARITRFPGAQDPIWPPSDMFHVGRELGYPHITLNYDNLPRKRRKLKQIPVQISFAEEVLKPYASSTSNNQLLDNSISTASTSGAAGYRCPRRHVMSGHDLQCLIRPRILHPLTTVNPQHNLTNEKPYRCHNSEPQAPPILGRAFDRIASSRTAFDRFECETQQWANKYSPRAPEEVLQQGQEPQMIRQWLTSLTVNSVNVQNVASVMGNRAKPGRKKRKRGEELDDFIVSSDDERDEMANVNDLEGSGNQPVDGMKRTVVRVNGQTEPGARLPHAAVISGPHGSGKSAAVYAIAQELGFEVFEINAGSRRSGKDIIDKVGDMTRNHLVRNEQEFNADGVPRQADDIEHADERLQEDLDSGRQSTMKTFFKSRTAVKKGSPKKAKRSSTKPTSSAPKAPCKEHKSQKQSLILLEEVDVLFEEDKLFWATVLDLIAETRRPIILTCTDESLLPLDDMILHGIFRFSLPSEKLATDYLLLIAANEGHLLQREAVAALCRAKCYDLRASLNELQFFCQMAIGDRKGGLEWLLLSPPALDAGLQYSQLCRVVSDDTYHKGMGWLGGEMPTTAVTGDLDHEVDMLSTACNSWDLDIEDDEALKLASTSCKIETTARTKLEQLGEFSLICDTYSLADLLPTTELRRPDSPPLDVTEPELNDKQRSHFIDGLPLLQADLVEDKTGLTPTIALTLRAMAARYDFESQALSNSSTEQTFINYISQTKSRAHTTYNFRQILSEAIEPIAQSPRPISILASELAPYIRSIAAYDLRLEAQREQLSAALSQEAGKVGSEVKARRTRASRAALEGGNKANTRRERWFPKETRYDLLLRTAGEGWLEAALEIREGPGTENGECLQEDETNGDASDEEGDRNADGVAEREDETPKGDMVDELS